jgi:hypothetical protein
MRDKNTYRGARRSAAKTLRKTAPRPRVSVSEAFQQVTNQLKYFQNRG